MSLGTADTRPRVPDDFVALGPPLAGGGSAVVWRARHRISGLEVALKVWHQQLATAEERAQFELESRLHQQLSGHPRIVRWLWAAAPADAPAWMATELHGVALSQLTSGGAPLDLRAGVLVGLDLLDGLAAVHALGIVHRDVTPANVLVEDGRAALCDLGIAMHVGSLTRDIGAGTTPYLAPELRVDGTVAPPSFRSDVYSAARTLRSALGDDIPDVLDALLTRAESEDPADRPTDAADFRDRLYMVVDRLGLLPPAAEPPGAARRSRRGPRVVLAAVAGVVVLGAAILALTAGSKPAAPSAAPPPVAAQQAPPDMDASGEPISLGKRSGGRCEGALVRDGRYEHRVDGRVVAITTVFFDPATHEACALLSKDNTDGSFGRSSYLALTLCNDAGSCDFDWFDYPHEAGPIRVQSADGCVSWRASMQDSLAAEWLVRDAVRQVGC